MRAHHRRWPAGLELAAAALLLLPLAVTPRSRAVEPGRREVLSSRQTANGLQALDASLRRLVATVSPAVVQVEAIGYEPAEASDGSIGSSASDLVRQRSLGSGVIADPEGYIVTSAHLVQGAQRTRVSLPASAGGARRTASTHRKVYEARIVGVASEIDLAVLKIEAHRLPTLSFQAPREAEPGEMVFAIGNAVGLGSAVTMGVVSAVDRQPDPDRPMVYVQTDAPLNPGNSGGPLVDVDGALVGINAFILTEGGGSEGLGFAVPARMAGFVYDRLRRYGQVGRVEIGAFVQSVTLELAQGLHLPIDSGVVVDDVVPGGPAAAAGLQSGDLIEAIGGRHIDGLPDLTEALYVHEPGTPLDLQVRRGDHSMALVVRGAPAKHPDDALVDLADPDQRPLSPLGIVALPLDDRVKRRMPGLRYSAGVVVAARVTEPAGRDSGLEAGDVIYALNRRRVTTPEELRRALEQLRPGDAAVLQIERRGRLHYLAFSLG